MISIWTLDKPYKDIRDERGTTRAWLPCSDVVVLSSTEHQTPYMMREITYVLDEGIRRAKKDGREKIVIFCDWYDLISYDTEARRVAAEWGGGKETKNMFLTSTFQHVPLCLEWLLPL